MMAMTRKVDYGIVALARLAECDADDRGPQSARQLADHDRMPLPLLAKALKDLQRANIVGSVRGACGGYYLREDPAQINIADVIRALDDCVEVVPCCRDEEQPSCQTMPGCPVSMQLRRLNEKILDMLSEITLEDLMADPDAAS